MFSAPSEPPHNVQVQATAPGELFVKWQVKCLLFAINNCAERRS